MSLSSGTPPRSFDLSELMNPPSITVSRSRTATLALASRSTVEGTLPTPWMAMSSPRFWTRCWMSITTNPSGLMSGMTLRVIPIWSCWMEEKLPEMPYPVPVG